MANVKIIPPREKKPVILRVAAYCRVSSDSSDQLHSYAVQIRAYTEEIGKHADWKLVDVYADEGLTGTRMDKREDFNRMLADCRKGKIDKVLVKSISRFARNTKDCLEALRELTSLGVSVFFEEENIHSETLTTELMVSVFGALAQQESVSISQNQRMSYQRRMKSGEFITNSPLFGYRSKDRKNLEIIEDEARIVRWIFRSYLAGRSAGWIAAELTRREIPSTDGRTFWYEQTVCRLLENEKYIGDALCQKSYTADVFPFIRRQNQGNVDQYYIENTHPAIISRETFERAQALRKQRSQHEGIRRSERPLARMIICGEYGSTFCRRETKNRYVTWGCRKHDDQAARCPMGRIAEDKIYAAFVRMYNKLKLHEAVILTPAVSQLEELNEALQRENPAMLAVNRAIAETSEQSHKISILQSRELLDAAACTAKLRDIEGKLTELRRERRRLLKNEDLEEMMDNLRKAAEVIHNGPDQLECFDEVLFAELVEKITAKSQTCICFRLCGGIELTEQLPEVGR